MKNEILNLRKAIEAKQAEFHEVLAEKERVQQVADSGTGDDGAIAELQRKRTEMLGKAFLDGKKANTEQIDREIEGLECALQEARRNAEIVA